MEVYGHHRADYAEALKWFGKAAGQGHAGAMVELGDIYRLGAQGVPQNYPEALKWYRKAAGQGDAEAQITMGRVYENGWAGVEKDCAEAVRWYRKAADQGDSKAQRIMGTVCLSGKAVAKDSRKHWNGCANQPLRKILTGNTGSAECITPAKAWSRIMPGRQNCSAWRRKGKPVGRILPCLYV